MPRAARSTSPPNASFEDQALTFEVKAPAAGLAKRLKTALLAQTDQRLKVRVRGEDPSDVDEDNEDEGTGTAVQPSKTPTPTPAQLAYPQRLQALSGRLQEACAPSTRSRASCER
jgi:hypothetical protein